MSSLEIEAAAPPTVALAELTLDPELQCRAKGTNKATVREYSEALKQGATLPPITVFRDSKGALFLADGWHRVAAAQLADITELAADIREGSRKDALLFAASANGSHGLRRTQADRRAAVMRLLAVYPKWSDRKLAEAARVDHKTVAAVRRAQKDGGEIPSESAGNSAAESGEIPTGTPAASDAVVAKLERTLRRVLEQWPAERRAELQERLLEAATAPQSPP